MNEVLRTVLDFCIAWYVEIAAVVLIVIAFFVGRASKKPVVKEVIVWKKAATGRRKISGKVHNILAPVIEKGKKQEV